MQIPELLAGLAARDIKLSVDRDRLRCSAPSGALRPELFRDQLRNRKAEIIAVLHMAEAASLQQPAIVPLRSGGTA